MSQTQYRIVRMAGRDVVATRQVAIGSAHVPRPMPITGRDALHLQSALLDKRTAQPQSLLQRIAGAVWKWL